MSDGIAQSKGAKVLLKSGGDTGDIIRAVLKTIPDVRKQTAEFSGRFTPDKEGLRDLWNFVKNEIHYNEDPLGVQWIREPARLWHDKEGDCKSFTVFIVSVLENLKLKYIIRFVNTENPRSRIVNHVYPVAVLPSGEKVVMDAVFTHFNAEHKYYSKKDYSMSEIYRLSGLSPHVGAADQAAVEQYWNDLKKIDAEIPDTILQEGGSDITTLTKGEFARFQQAMVFEAQGSAAPSEQEAMRFQAAALAVKSGSVAGIRGIGAFSAADMLRIESFLKTTSTQTAAAFPSPVLALPDNVTGLGSLGDKIKDLAKDVLNVWKKILNWIFKQALPGSSHFFLYTFLKQDVGAKTGAKRAKQTKILNWIQKAGKFDSPQDLSNAITAGIIKKYGKNPQTILNAAVTKPVAGISGTFDMFTDAINDIIDIIERIVKLFKKDKGTDVTPTAADVPDLQELATEQTLAYKPLPGVPTPSSGKDNNTMLLSLAALGVGLYFVNH